MFLELKEAIDKFESMTASNLVRVCILIKVFSLYGHLKNIRMILVLKGVRLTLINVLKFLAILLTLAHVYALAWFKIAQEVDSNTSSTDPATITTTIANNWRVKVNTNSIYLLFF